MFMRMEVGCGGAFSGGVWIGRWNECFVWWLEECESWTLVNGTIEEVAIEMLLLSRSWVKGFEGA